MKVKIVYSQKFLRQFKKLERPIKQLFIEKEDIFKNNPFDSRLKTHKLSGQLSGRWSFSVNYQYRVIFSFNKEQNEAFFFIAIGSHTIYD